LAVSILPKHWEMIDDRLPKLTHSFIKSLPLTDLAREFSKLCQNVVIYFASGRVGNDPPVPGVGYEDWLEALCLSGAEIDL
jgi:hypothetical protein